MWIDREVWEHMQATMKGLQERNDRLTEALALKEGQRLALPRPEQNPFVPHELEKIPGYFDTKPIPIVTNTGGTKQ